MRHGRADQLAHGPLRLALGHQVHETFHFSCGVSRVSPVAAQGPRDRFPAQIVIVHFLRDMPTRGQPQLKAETPRQLREERVQRADAKAMEVANQLSQHRLATFLRQLFQLEEAGQFLPSHRIQGRVRQAEDDAVENLPSSLAGEGRGQDLVGRDPLVQQSQIAIGQLKCLAGAGGRADQNVREHAHPFDSFREPSSNRGAKAPSWQIAAYSVKMSGGGWVGGQNRPWTISRATRIAS